MNNSVELSVNGKSIDLGDTVLFLVGPPVDYPTHEIRIPLNEATAVKLKDFQDAGKSLRIALEIV